MSSSGIIVLSAPLFKSRFAQSFVQVIQTNILFFVDIHEKQAIWDSLPAFWQLPFSFVVDCLGKAKGQYEDYIDSYFDFTAYGFPDQVFGVIRIPRMDLEMPLYLGASYENMSNGASVLAQTSIPIGGENCNSVIAGHRSWNGYKKQRPQTRAPNLYNSSS